MSISKPFISIFVTSRIDGNDNSALLSLIESLEKSTYNINSVELLVKFDDDDYKAKKIISKLSNRILRVIYIFGKRHRGYEDIHIGYTSLIPFANQSSHIYCCMADDMVVRDNWDVLLKNAYKKTKGKYFIIHQRPHPPSNRIFLTKYKENSNFDYIPWRDLYIIDEAPCWSASLIRAVQGFGPISFTDLWTLVLEKKLLSKRLNITYFTDSEIIYRKLHKKIDYEGTKRWNGPRLRNFDYADSSSFDWMVNKNVSNIILALKLDKMYFYARIRFLLFFFVRLIKKIHLSLPVILPLFSEFHGLTPTIMFSTRHNNIVGFNHRFYVVPKRMGPINFTEDEEKLSSLKSHGNFFIATLKGFYECRE